MWLSVWERNPRAIAFYGKCGFRMVGSKDFWVGSDRQTDHVMVLELRP
jgi:diamine N-acetyltransferase